MKEYEWSEEWTIVGLMLEFDKSRPPPETPAFYEATRPCLNCFHYQTFQVPIGTRVATFMLGRICSRCHFPLEPI